MPRIYMSEELKRYSVGRSDIVEELRDSGALNVYGEGFVLPAPEQVKALRIHLSLSQVEFARLVGVTFKEGKGSQTIRKWETPEGNAEHRKISYAAWRLLLIAGGIVDRPVL